MPENPYQSPSRPIFRDTPGRWAQEILSTGSFPEIPAVSERAWSIAVAVFYAAGNWSETYQAPADFQIHAWAHLFEHAHCLEWLTVDLAERAVHAYFRESITGHLLPAHVIQGAAIIKLEQGDMA